MEGYFLQPERKKWHWNNISCHLPGNAFEEAISYGNQEARINLVATLLELNEMEQLYQSLDQFAAIDSFFVSLKKDIQTMESGTDLSEEMTQSYVYYHYASLDKETIGQILKKADQLYIEGLWMKIYKEKLIEDPASSEDYVKLFNPYLNDEQWDLQLATFRSNPGENAGLYHIQETD